MKKRIVLMALLAAAAVGSAPVASYAAEVKIFQVSSGDCVQVYSGESIASLREVLNGFCVACEPAISYCPDYMLPSTETPSTETPSTETPSTETPSTETPSTETPSTETPSTETPSTETPDADELSYAEQVVKLVNEERAKQGLPALTVQTEVTAAANVRALEIVQSFSHTRPDGSSFSSALKEQGAVYRGSGENIAYGQRTPEQVMEAWMNSDGHRANILNKSFRNIGVGYYQDERGVNYWVQLFTY